MPGAFRRSLLPPPDRRPGEIAPSFEPTSGRAWQRSADLCLFRASLVIELKRIGNVAIHSAMTPLVRPLALASSLAPACLFAAAAEPAAAAEAVEAFDYRAFLGPFHTVTLHLPIGFVVIAAILEGYHILRPSRALRNAISVVLVFSGLAAAVAALFGIFLAEGGGYDSEALEHHRWYGIAAGALTIVLAIVHPLAFREGRGRLGASFYRVLLLGDLVVLTIAGHGGGDLTHGSTYLTENAPAWLKEWIEPADEEGPGDGAAAGGGEYAATIRPIFEEKCFKCHGEEKQKGDYRMDTVEGLFAAGESELDPIVKGNPMESYLVETILLPEDDDLAMPPDGKDRLTPEETFAVIQWIWDGAKTE